MLPENRDLAFLWDILIHMYDRIDLFEVWKVVTVSIPQLVEYIEPLLPAEPSS